MHMRRSKPCQETSLWGDTWSPIHRIHWLYAPSTGKLQPVLSCSDSNSRKRMRRRIVPIVVCLFAALVVGVRAVWDSGFALPVITTSELAAVGVDPVFGRNSDI